MSSAGEGESGGSTGAWGRRLAKWCRHSPNTGRPSSWTLCATCPFLVTWLDSLPRCPRSLVVSGTPCERLWSRTVHGSRARSTRDARLNPPVQQSAGVTANVFRRVLSPRETSEACAMLVLRALEEPNTNEIAAAESGGDGIAVTFCQRAKITVRPNLS